LANGMRVRFAPDPALDDVTVVVRHGVGSADDPEGKDGLAHLVEHLMFAGSKHVGPNEYWRWMARIGGRNLNAQTGLDSTEYYVTVPPEQLPTVLWLESDRMAFPAEYLDEARVGTEWAIVADEARQKVDDATLSALSELAWESTFPVWHPYHRELNSQSLGRVSMVDVQAFLRTWYTPQNAILAVAGRFDPVAALALAAQYFGDLPGGDPPARPVIPPWRVGDASVEMRAGVTRDCVTVSWATPALDTPGDAELDVAAAILTDPQGRLRREIVDDSRLAVSVWSEQRSARRSSVFQVGADLTNGAPPGEVKQRILNVVDGLADSITFDEVQRAIKELRDASLFRLETSFGRAHHMAEAATADTTWGLGKYERILPAEVKAALNSALVPDNRTTIVVEHDGTYAPRGTVIVPNPLHEFQ